MKNNTSLSIAGFKKHVTGIWPDKIAAVLYLSKCNFRCRYCFNSALVFDTVEKISFKKVKNEILTQKAWIDGVVVTGGEPTLYSKLYGPLHEIRDLGLLTRISTNGSCPYILKMLIDDNLVDSIAMDIKTSFKNYPKIVGVKVNISKIRWSIELLKAAKIDVEFRTTVVPGLIGREDVIQIRKEIKDQKYYLQQFVPLNCLDPTINKVKPYSKEEIDSWSLNIPLLE